MKQPKLWAVAVLAACAWLLAGCGSGSGGLANDLTGRWVRLFNVPGSSFSMTAVQSGGNVTGNGTYAIEAGRSGTFTLTGTEAGATFTLTFTPDTGLPLTYVGGFVSATEIQGTVHQGNDAGNSMTMQRQ